MTPNDSGLAAIARSARPPLRNEQSLNAQPAWATGGKPPLEFDGRPRKTSLILDIGLWDCVLETVHVLTMRLRPTGRARVTIASVFAAAFVAFHELPLDEQIERIRKLR